MSIWDDSPDEDYIEEGSHKSEKNKEEHESFLQSVVPKNLSTYFILPLIMEPEEIQLFGITFMERTCIDEKNSKFIIELKDEGFLKKDVDFAVLAGKINFRRIKSVTDTGHIYYKDYLIFDIPREISYELECFYRREYSKFREEYKQKIIREIEDIHTYIDKIVLKDELYADGKVVDEGTHTEEITEVAFSPMLCGILYVLYPSLIFLKEFMLKEFSWYDDWLNNENLTDFIDTKTFFEQSNF